MPVRPGLNQAIQQAFGVALSGGPGAVVVPGVTPPTPEESDIVIDIADWGIVLNDSSVDTQTRNAGILSDRIADMAAGRITDLTITWSGDLYTNQTFPYPFVHVNGTNPLYFGIRGQEKTRLIYTGTDWAINWAFTSAPAQENDKFVRIELSSLNVQAPNGSGVRLQDGGKYVVCRSLSATYCNAAGLYFNEMDGSYFDDVQAAGCLGDGITFDTCRAVAGTRINARNNGGSGVVITGSAAWNGVVIDAEGNGQYGVDIQGLNKAEIVVWQEANRQVATGGVVYRNPSSPAGAIWPQGYSGESLPQGRLINSYKVQIKGQYGQDSNTGFLSDWLSQQTCTFPDDWRTYDLSAWTQKLSKGKIQLKNLTSGQCTLSYDSGTGANTVTLLSGSPWVAVGLEVRDPTTTQYPGGDSWNTINTGDLLALTMTIRPDDATYAYLQTLITSGAQPVINQVAAVNAYVSSYSGGPAETQYWYAPAAANTGLATFALVLAAGLFAGNATQGGPPRVFLDVMFGLSGNVTQDCVFTISDINFYYLPASW